MKTCGKFFHPTASAAERRCGQQLPGSDWILQCPDCQSCDRVEAAISVGKRLEWGKPTAYPTDVFNGAPGVADPNERAVDEILARLESYYRGDEKLARGAKHLSVTTDDLRTLTDYIKFLRGQLRAANRR